MFGRPTGVIWQRAGKRHMKTGGGFPAKASIVDQQTKNPEIILHFDRFTGGLTVVAGDGAESYDIEVDDRFAGAHAPAMTPVNPSRRHRQAA
jgi:hypothetical protein